MKQINGVRVSERIRENVEIKRTPILMVGPN